MALTLTLLLPNLRYCVVDRSYQRGGEFVDQRNTRSATPLRARGSDMCCDTCSSAVDPGRRHGPHADVPRPQVEDEAEGHGRQRAVRARRPFAAPAVVAVSCRWWCCASPWCPRRLVPAAAAAAGVCGHVVVLPLPRRPFADSSAHRTPLSCAAQRRGVVVKTTHAAQYDQRIRLCFVVTLC